MPGSDLDELIEKTQRENSYFDDPNDLEGTARESWERIEKDPTMARVLGVNPENYGEE